MEKKKMMDNKGFTTGDIIIAVIIITIVGIVLSETLV